MKKIAITAMVLILVSLSITGCLGDKNKFIGTWQFSEGGTLTFYQNDTVSVTLSRANLLFQSSGLFTYSIANNNITFTSRGSSVGITLTFPYSFPNENTLILTSGHTPITLVKVSST